MRAAFGLLQEEKQVVSSFKMPSGGSFIPLIVIFARRVLLARDLSWISSNSTNHEAVILSDILFNGT